MIETMNLFEPNPTPAPAIAEKMKPRHFYRCADCLTVVAVADRLEEIYDDRRGRVPKAICDACEGGIEYLGETVADSFLQKQTGWRPICDARCTGARGPSCDCHCGGKNHGSGIVVPVYTHGPIPRVGTPKAGAARAIEYRQLCEQFKAEWSKAFQPLGDRRKAGEWLNPDEFRKWNRGIQILANFRHAKGMRAHHARNKSIRNAIAEVLQ